LLWSPSTRHARQAKSLNQRACSASVSNERPQQVVSANLEARLLDSRPTRPSSLVSRGNTVPGGSRPQGTRAKPMRAGYLSSATQHSLPVSPQFKVTSGTNPEMIECTKAVQRCRGIQCASSDECNAVLDHGKCLCCF
jgi:hypothetical protein